LRYLNQYDFRSVEAEDFATKIQILHDRVRGQLHENNHEYKSRVDQKRREVQFEVGYEVLDHLRQESFPRGTYSKLNMKRTGPCKILINFSTNAYEIEFPDIVGLSSIFNLLDLYPYRKA